jgi:formylglycine-generating enzyme required for sulfatase activity
LPTEAEWEFVASGGGERDYPWGDEVPSPARANYIDSRLNRTSPVGTYPFGMTSEGLFDMAGNVWEWCSDWFDSTMETHVLRGGSWNSEAIRLRCTYRDWLNPDLRNIGVVGFRVVRPVHL